MVTHHWGRTGHFLTTAVIPSYCSSTPPTPLNTQTPSSFSATVGSVTSYTCQLGYMYSSVWEGPAATCKSSTTTTGVWGLNTGLCVGNFAKLAFNKLALITSTVV